MAVQSKTLIKDVGSAVLAEVVSQMNRAAGYSSTHLGIALTIVATDMSFVICKFTEDVLVTRVEFGFGDAASNLNNAADSIALFTGTDPSGTAASGTEVGRVTGFGPGAGAFVATADLWTTITDLAAASSAAALTGTDAPFQVAAGDALTIEFDLTATAGGPVAAGQTIESVNVTYRPVKDALNLQPAFTPAMTNFRSVPR